MLPASAERILGMVAPGDVVLDVGGWAAPFGRADWVLDLQPHATRGLYGPELGGPERFGADTWVQRDICDRAPWPFADDEFDFAICSHTLEDVRDPVWVCSELVRVARAGYIEVPSRLEEQSFGIQGPWVGWGHHHWLIDPVEDGLEFVFKHQVIHGQPAAQFRTSFHDGLSAQERVTTLWWQDRFTFRERLLLDAESLDPYLADFVAANGPATSPRRLRRRRP